jgi:hypothetical protein
VLLSTFLLVHQLNTAAHKHCADRSSCHAPQSRSMAVSGICSQALRSLHLLAQQKSMSNRIITVYWADRDTTPHQRTPSTVGLCELAKPAGFRLPQPHELIFIAYEAKLPVPSTHPSRLRGVRRSADGGIQRPYSAASTFQRNAWLQTLPVATTKEQQTGGWFQDQGLCAQRRLATQIRVCCDGVRALLCQAPRHRRCPQRQRPADT